MLLSKIINGINLKEIPKYDKKIKIKSITSNSNLVIENSILIADFNKNFKQKYINEALKKGAVFIITNRKIRNLKIPQVVVNNINKIVAKILLILKPYGPLKTIAVTGTNGKTSVVWIISSILNTAGIKIKSLGTLGFFENLKKINESSLTTPEKEELHQIAFSSTPKNYYFIFEASSHSISKKRINNLGIDIAVITNISHDHLDFHKTYKNYYNTKFKLFFNNLKNTGVAIINDNIPRIHQIKTKLKKRNINFITYGSKNSDVYFLKSKKNNIINIFSKKIIINYETNIDFEIQNLLCSISCCVALGLKKETIIKSLKKINKPKGRMELANKLYNKSRVLIDYAHTPDALKNILINNYHNSKKPNLVFGCGGDRDHTKRKKMALIAKMYANNVYITDDNPRNEKPEKIRHLIHLHCPTAFNIARRRLAIKLAIENLLSNEVLIIAGKGHENKQIYKDKIFNFDDLKIANYYINKKNQKYYAKLKNKN